MAKRRSPGTRLLFGGAAALLIIWLLSFTAVVLWGWRDNARPSAAIVVLGAAQYDGRPSPVFRARLDHAIALWKDGVAPSLIVTGGTGRGDTTSEAAVGRLYALRQGVPDTVIFVEPHGRTTRESLLSVVALMDDVPGNSVVLVSDPFHMLRLSILAERLGLEATTSPTRMSPITLNRSAGWRYVLSESVKAPLVLFLPGRDR